MATSIIPPQLLERFIQSLEGAEIARILSIASFSLTVYEYIITLDEEVKYFWTNQWTISQILFFINRYLPPLIMIISIVCFSVSNPLPEFCKPAIQAAFLLNTLAITVIQAILVIRIWYLFQGSRWVQIGIISGFVGSVVLSVIFLYLSVKNLKIVTPDTVHNFFPGLHIKGCQAQRPPNFWRIYLPSLILHSILYVLTAMKALKNRRLLKDAPILKRLLRDGGFFYFIVFASVSFTAIGSFLNEFPKVNIPAIYSHFMLAMTSIAVSRVLFSIHSLAEKLGSNSAWLLSNVDLSRVGWKRGAHDGEIIIELDTVYDKHAPESFDREFTPISSDSARSLQYTRVGVFGI